MKKINLFKVMIVSLLFYSLFSIPTVEAKEHSLEDLYIHTYIHEDGSATITEIRKTTLSEGTENFDVIENLGESTITDFTVNEDGITYDFTDNWNINASREEKTFKNGIIKTQNGYELVWGIGEYGKHIYELQYTVTDFIKQVDGEEQILFWRYVNDQTNIPPEKVTIEIEAEKYVSEDTEKIWAFGFDGKIQFQDGKVIAISDTALRKNDYVTVLVEFSDGVFQTRDKLNKTMDEIKDEAFADSDYKSDFSYVDILLPPIAILTPILITVVVFFILFRSDVTRKRRRKYKGEYERELPFDGPFVDLYQLLLDMKTTKLKHLLSAFILKWIKEERIDIQEEKVGFIFNHKVPVIYLLNKEMDNKNLEGRLFEMFIAAENAEGKLQTSDFTKWVEKNRQTMRSWEKDAEEKSIEELKKLGIFQTKERKTLFLKREIDESTASGNELKEAIFKYMNYLEDYSLLNEHEAINVTIWDEIMIWAAVLGITDEVYKQFQALYPAYKDESIYSPTMITASNSYGQTISSARSYVNHGGGGGSVSGGGGGGSFGGGSGGGTR